MRCCAGEARRGRRAGRNRALRQRKYRKLGAAEGLLKVCLELQRHAARHSPGLEGHKESIVKLLEDVAQQKRAES